MADQSRASAPMSMSSSMCRVGDMTVSIERETGLEVGEAGFHGERELRPVVRIFSKQTSKAASAWEVNAIRVSPAISFGLPYSLPTASLI